jgi:calcineurin-like phosphoesterase family protein
VSRVVTGADFHLGANNAYKFRGFSTAEEHNEVVFDNLATYCTKRDSLILVGDVCQSEYWLQRLHQLVIEKHVQKITLVPGNHDVERKITMQHLVWYYCEVLPYLSKRNCWWSHIPMHPDHLRGRGHNIHGHLHSASDPVIHDPRFINVAIDFWGFTPVSFAEMMATHESKGRL